MEGGGRTKSSPLSKPPKFCVYQNPTLSAALTANSLRPAKTTFLCIFFVSIASAFSLLGFVSREDGFINNLVLGHISHTTAYLLTKAMQIVVGLVFLGTLSALIRAFSLRRARNIANVLVSSPSKGAKEQRNLTERQLALLGMRPKPGANTNSPKKPPKSKPQPSTSPYHALVPLHQSVSNSNRSSLPGAEKSNTGNGSKMGAYYTSSKSPVSSPSSLYLVPSTPLQGPSVQTSPALDRQVSSPWSKQKTPIAMEITTEEMLEQFLADVDEKLTESAAKLATPPATINSFGIASPSNVSNSATNSGTTRSTPLRPVRMSPGSQKFSTPSKKGEGDLPVPMSMEESIDAFQNLGIYPHIEQWRDRLRQWFSSVLLNPLLNKIETSHIQVMQAAARLGITITVNQIGTDSPSTGASTTVSPIDGSKEWQPAFTLDEDGMLHQLRAALVQSIDASMSKLPLGNLQQPLPQNSLIPVLQECVDAITEHQRLHALMKGEWVKGLLPQTSVRADYMVQRIRELAEGTCLKNYEYLGSGEVYDKVNKKWTLELPTDSHLLLYLFCAFLEHPKWMLHVDPTPDTSSQTRPLFLGLLPPKERFPESEKFLAVISSVPSVLHPGACILFVGKQSPPIFAVYWEKKLQFSLQGRTALWDAILLLCHRIKVAYGGVIRGMHLGSSAFSILPILDLENEE
ncbi:transmembrane protein 209 [Telopea speciosissima]|uniref:transmembrane protein 209 n=1 Tax=Telopea speciosissima TaxID=54955 RepID=UPI001CC622C3|nr:transmembrane protein 209 [Telopea speciosissima]